MGKIWVEVCLISARGLKRSSFLWKLQWFAVGWIDPNNKYCTRIDAPGNSNPVWKTKCATLVDESSFQDMVLNVQVYSREPVFLRERLQGTATIVLKEFVAKYNNSSETSRSVTEEVGSYQLRKRNSGKPQGFVDVSIRISEEKEEPVSFPGSDGGFVLMSNGSNITLSNGGGSGFGSGSGQGYPSQQPITGGGSGFGSGSGQGYPSQQPITGGGSGFGSGSGQGYPLHQPITGGGSGSGQGYPSQQPIIGGGSGSGQGYPSQPPITGGGSGFGSGSGQGYPSQPSIVRRQRQENQPQLNYPYTNPTPYPTGYSNPSAAQPRPQIQSQTNYPYADSTPYSASAAPRTPPPPPPPSNVGYIPTFLPRTDLSSDSYIDMPSSSSSRARQGPRPPGFAMGATAGAMGATAGALAAGAVIFGDDFMSGFDVPSGLHDPSLIMSIDPPF